MAMNTPERDLEEAPLAPKLRFAEFVDHGPWDAEPLSDLCDRLTDTVGDSQLIPVSISAGKGFVPQAEKFGRDISGSQYSKYIWLQRGDFAYNRGNSKRFPQGCVYQLTEFDEAATSNAFHCFRLHDNLEPAFVLGFFERNGHGRQLIGHITSSARSDGLLNISAGAFFGITVPVPPKEAEQRKVADCLGSLDGLIAAEGRKLKTLRQHKQGLMQRLFPRPGETAPKLRFPEFRDAAEWEVEQLGFVCELYQPETLAASEMQQDGPYPVYGANGVIGKHDRYNHEDSEVVVTCRGATCGEVNRTQPKSWITGNAMVVRPKDDRISKDFVFYSLKSDGLMSVVSGSAQPQITRAGFSPFLFVLPERKDEQQRIADCLGSLDARLAAQSRKIDTLKQHKQGLMQRLFPSPEGR